MNVLVTGSSGLVGSAVMELLHREGHHVVGFDQRKSPITDHLTVETGDLCDFPRLASIIQKYNIGAIVHSGGISHPHAGEASPYETVRTNILGTTTIFEAARLFHINKVVYLSSGAVYGNHSAGVTTVETKVHPENTYAVSKLTGEYLGEVYNRNYGMNVISLRLAFVYGPNRFMPDPIKSLLERAVNGLDIDDAKGADQQLEFIYVKDAALGVYKALQAEKCSSSIFNIGTGVNTKMNEVAAVIKNLYPNISIKIGPGDLGYDFIGAFDCSEAEKQLGFKANYRLEDGIAEYAKYLEENKKSKS
ncbi:NAD(P)-dependent oxidoreductase [Paenibacillus sp. MSJ-34]|uniref:NAD-dependent epimerase/dehydratase family protein n=1 Tax=Paenibacillus sp. MSJ-34 TaxID=2841529 RepID=UPI001C101C54|nr:NAD(P)-dependent oxidoreductase [Paenibacillus sp. MSJ-34]MBU5445106.1 NAD(P)-dependent oxidoreductase [Paenibacillus sp. MSJ-34]